MRLLLILFAFVVAASTRLGGQSAPFERLTIEQGLSQGMIYDILQTRDGFLWVATKDGLNRYDGYNFKVFNHDPYNPFSLAENTVTALLEDSRGWLWVCTESKSLDVYDRHTGLFHHFTPNFKRNSSIPALEIYSIREAPDGDIYLLQHGSDVIRIAIPAAWKTQLPETPELNLRATLFTLEQFNQAAGQVPEELNTIDFRNDGKWWAYSNRRPYEIDRENGVARPVADPTSAADPRDIWMPFNFNILHFEHGQARAIEFPPGQKIHWVYVRPAPDGGTWVAVNNGLWHLAPGEMLDVTRPDWEVDHNISAVTTDRNGNIWIGTQGYGLRKFTPRQRLFHTGGAGTSISGLWRDNGGRYYCKVVNEVFPYDPVTGRVGATHAFPDGPQRVLDMHIDTSGTIWLLGRDNLENGLGKLERMDPATGGRQVFSFPFDSYIYARLLRDRQGRFWISGLNGQLLRFDPANARFETFNYSTLFGEKASSVRALALAEDGNGTLWVGTQFGLIQCLPKNGALDFQLIQVDARNPKGLSNNSIACLLPDPADPAGVLWIGTKGGGINRLDLHNNEYQHITTRDGLPDNVIYGMLPGSRGDLWCSTNRGLVQFTPGRAVTAFTAAMGLQDNEFNTQAFFKAANGELLFGGVNGLNRFFPDELRLDTTPPPVFVVGLEINHQPAAFGDPGSPLTMPLEYLQQLQLDYDQNNLSFELAALDFTDPGQNCYRYRLVGLDADWVDAGTQHFAHFTHLEPGRYTFRVQGSNGEGPWQEALTPITVIVHPPWYRSNLAWLLYAVLLAGAVWQAYRIQIRRVQLREQLAFEQRETERIKALEQVKTNFFSNVTHEFRTPLALILEPARRILAKTLDPETRENARHIEANSHRLLNLVNQLLDMAKLENGSIGIDRRHGDFAESVREAFRAFLPLAEQRGIQLSLQVSKDIPAFSFDANKTEIVLNNLISNALKFTPEGGKVEVRVTVDDGRWTVDGGRWTVDGGRWTVDGGRWTVDGGRWTVDGGRWTVDGGRWTVDGEARNPLSEPQSSLNPPPSTVYRPPSTVYRPPSTVYRPPSTVYRPPSTVHRPPSTVTIEVRDTGVGIPAGLLDKIFERFYQVDDTHTRNGEGTGIGLALSKELAERMEGGIAVVSEQGRGSTFTFWLPIVEGIGLSGPETSPAGAAESPAAPPVYPVVRPESGRPLVLLIEDNAELRGFIHQYLAAQWQVVEASNGEEGVRKAVELVPDLVISDLMMPLKDGYAVCDEIKSNELTAHVPVILLTAKGGMDARIKGLRTGADDYLTKPFNTEELLARMDNLVEGRRRLRLRYALAGPLAQTTDAEPELLTNQDREFLRRFTLTVEQHLSDETMGVEELAQKMFISRVQLHRKLKALTDQNVTDFVRDYRLERAMAMLKNREGLVYEVAARVGFGSEKYFSRAFKEKFGVPPSQIG